MLEDEAELEGPDPIDIHVGLRIRTLRKAKGMSQDKLGSAIGVAYST